MRCKVVSALNKHNMLSGSERIAVALSGGADSMALLHILNSIKSDFGFTLSAAHVNHGIRGEAADADESFVKAQCEAMGIELKILRADVPAIAAAEGEGLEECGRRVRYDFFASLGEDVKIATAHNADDRAETFLLNFTRGASLRGLCSIPYVRGNIIRPLLDCTKEEILQYCKDNSVPFVTDLTNSDVTYSRNRIRCNVVPELRTINSGFDKNAARCIASLCEDNALIEMLTGELIKNACKESEYDAQILFSANPALGRRAVSRIIEIETGITADYNTVVAVHDMLNNNGSIQIAGGSFVRVRKGILDFPDFSPYSFDEFTLDEGVQKNDDFIVTVKIFNTAETECLQKCSGKVLEYRIDCDKICGIAVARARKPGDSIALKNRGCTKTLKKLFNENGVQPEKRDRLIVASDDDGLIFVEGFGIGEKYAVTPETKKIMQITIERKCADA